MNEKDIKNEIVERTRVMMKKFDTRDGDMIIVTFKEDVAQEQIIAFSQCMTESIPDGVTVVCTKENVTMEHLPKDLMNKHGWYNINDSVGSNTIQ